MLRGQRARLAGAISLLVLLALAAWPARAASVEGEVAIRFSASSTLHDFEGSCAPVAFTLARDGHGRWSAEVEVPVAGMQTGNSRRDANMRAMLDAGAFPVIQGSFHDIDADSVRGSAELPFVLRIRSVSRPIRARVTDWVQENDGELSFDARFSVSLDEFDLRAPGFLFIRVADAVQVTAHVRLRRS